MTNFPAAGGLQSSLQRANTSLVNSKQPSNPL